jgi:hypothetical protein
MAAMSRDSCPPIIGGKWMLGSDIVTLIMAILLSVIGVAAYISIVTGIWRSSKSEGRASALLRQSLSDEEWQQMERTGYLSVLSPSVPGRVYRVPTHMDQVEVHESGRLRGRLCVQPATWLPASDVVLMHKLMIEGNEEEYLRTANYYPHEDRKVPR